MKSQTVILAITLACLSQGVDAQQPFPGGGQPYAVPAVVPGYGPTAPARFVLTQAMPATLPGRVPAPMPGAVPPAVATMPGAQWQMMAPAARMGVPETRIAAYAHAEPRVISQPPPTFEPVLSDVQPVSADAGPWQGHCSGGEGCSSDDGGCSACDSCGGPSCEQACDGCRSGGLLHSLKASCRAKRHGRRARRAVLRSHLHDYFRGPRAVRVWGGVEGLWWWNKERSLPALATTSLAGTPISDAGVLGQPGTGLLFGGEFDGDASEGVRVTIGFWLDGCQNLGVFARGFQFGEENISFGAASAGDPILARPFFDVEAGVQDALVVAYPGISRGRINIQTSNEARGYDLLLRKLLYYGECNRIDLVGGYYYGQLLDEVGVGHEVISVDPQGRVPVGTSINTFDSFEAENIFNGGSIGVMAQGYDGRLTWNLLTKIAFGNNRERMSITGRSTTSIPNFGSSTIDQGLLALDSNTGVYEDDSFAVIPELDLSVMYNIASWLSVSVGYTVVYWDSALLAGPAVDTAINPTQIDGPLIGPAAPTYTLADDDFWMQGLTFGIHGRF